MCGLVGMMGDLTLKHKDAMSDLLFLDTLRGPDATGVAVIDNKGEAAWYKTTVPGYEYIEHRNFKDLLRLTDRVWIGHNRFGTVGRNTRLNAHPFVVDSPDNDGWLLVGAHNGTLKNKYEIDKDNKFGTDSEALLNLIGKIGAKEAIAKAEGAWALTWYDGVEEEMNIIRNNERPLCYGFSKNRKVVFWASEPWMIRAATSRRGIEMEENLWSCSENVMYTFKKPKDGEEIAKPLATGGIEGKKPVAAFQNGYWNSQASRQGYQPQGTKENGTSSPTGTAQTPLKHDEVRGYQGEPVSLTVLKELKRNGCDWCGDVIEVGSPFGWLDELSLVCHRCNHGAHFADGQGRLILTVKQKEALELVNQAKAQRNQ